MQAERADVNRSLLVMVPGAGIREADFHSHGMVAAVHARRSSVAVVTVDPGLGAYLDQSVERNLLDRVLQAQRVTGASRIWLAGVSLGCKAILRCVQLSPGTACGLMLITPYIASTGLVAEVGRAGGLRAWAEADWGRTDPDRALLRWLAMAPPPRMLLGWALDDRFAATAAMLAPLLPGDHVVRMSGQHDWTSWEALWCMMLDKDPFGPDAAAALC